MVSLPASRFANLVYAQHGAATMLDAIQRAAHANVASVFVTDDSLPNPWDSTPLYWATEIAVLETTTVTPPMLDAGAGARPGMAFRATANPARGVVRLSTGASPRTRSLVVYDAAGRAMRRLRVDPGTVDVGWDGRDGEDRSLPAGLYFARLEGDRHSARVVWLR